MSDLSSEQDELYYFAKNFSKLKFSNQAYIDSTQKQKVQNEKEIEKLKKDYEKLRNDVNVLKKTCLYVPGRVKSAASSENNFYRLKLDDARNKKKKSQESFEQLNKKLEELKSEAKFINDDNNPYVKRIKLLENKLDKAMIKYNEAMSIRRTYEQILTRLKEERAGYDNQIAAIQKSLKAKGHDLNEFKLLLQDSKMAKVYSKLLVDNTNLSKKAFEDHFTQLIQAHRNENLKELQKEKSEERKKKNIQNEVQATISDDKPRDGKENKANITFKPGGPQETFGFYRDIQTPESTGTLYITPDPKRFIMEGQKVKTENRGIFTNPTKVGIAHPNDYFGFYFADEPTQERIKTLGEKDIKDKLDKVQILKKKLPPPRPPFSPASLKKCEPFSNNIETYGLYNDVEKEQKLKEYAEYKKKGNPKYSKSLPKGSVKHDKPFQPARLVYIGRDGLFDDNLYTLPEMTEKDKAKLRIKTVREKKEEEEKNKATRRVPFTFDDGAYWRGSFYAWTLHGNGTYYTKDGYCLGKKAYEFNNPVDE